MLEMKYETFILLLKPSFLYFNCQAVVIVSEVKGALYSLQCLSEISQHRVARGSSESIDPCICSFYEGWELLRLQRKQCYS